MAMAIQVRQGGVGDCWFMSALAVVAERHDLMRKLLPNLNEGAESGCHEAFSIGSCTPTHNCKIL